MTGKKYPQIYRAKNGLNLWFYSWFFLILQDVILHFPLKFVKLIIYIFWSYLGSPELVQRVQAKYFEKSGSKELPLIRAVVNNDWSQVINCVAINSNWKEALVAALTYAEQGTIHILRSHF